MYPNPAGSNITFRLSSTQPTIIMLYNAMGRKVYEATAIGNTVVATHGWPSGIYTYSASSLQSATVRGTILVQR